MPDAPVRWLLLVHQLPPRPLYLRAKIRHRLTRVGAVAIKNSVYALPDRDECLEDFQWIAQEAVAGGGEAFVCRVEFVAGLSADALVDRFRADVAARFAPLREALERALRDTRASRAGDALARLVLLRRQVADITRTDFFGSTAGHDMEALMTTLDKARRPPSRARATTTRANVRDLTGRVWVTRTDPHVDRLASAWLVRRFVDPAARFRFVPASGGGVRPDELSFDMVDATFGHEGDRCTFETLVLRLGLTDRALGPMAEVVHDIDLKDGKFGHPEAAGIDRLVRGLTDAHPDSATRIEAALPVFDALHAAFGGKPPRRAARGRSKK